MSASLTLSQPRTRILPGPITALAVLSVLAAAMPATAQPTDLLFSEYVEGSNINKAIEIYNGTGSAVDLAAGGYRIEIYFNQDPTPDNFPLTGLILPGEVFVVARGGADPQILEAAEPPDGNGQVFDRPFFNGSDTLVLYQGDRIIDSFGKRFQLPNNTEWLANGVGTMNDTLRRKSSVCSGDIDPDDLFDPSLEWELVDPGNPDYPNVFDGLGFHTVDDCPPPPDPCEPTRVLTCESAFDSGRNDDPDGRQRLDAYSCLLASYPAPEIVYSFVAPVGGSYRVELGDLVDDLDVMVLGPGICDPQRCLAASGAGGVGDEALSFSAEAGAEYFIVVDGLAGVASHYTVGVICPFEIVPDFSWSPQYPTAGQTVRFYDVSEGQPTSWLWDFDDGGRARGRTPRHRFDDPGTYDVELTVSHALSDGFVSRSVTVAATDAAVTVSGPATGRVDRVLTFTAAASRCEADPGGWEWGIAGGEVVTGGSGAAIGLRWPAGGVKVVSAVNSACGGATGSHAIEIARRQAAAPPPVPTGLTAEPLTATEVELRWRDNSATEDGFRIERRGTGGAFAEIARAPANVTSAAVSVAGVASPVTHPSDFRVKAFNVAGSSAPSNQASSETVAQVCDGERTLCLPADKRFEVTVDFFNPLTGRWEAAVAKYLTTDTGYFTFFNPGNVELVLKLLDATVPFGYFWVYYGALSDVRYRIEVTDTETGNVARYNNPLGTLASHGDSQAFPAGPEGAGSAASPSGPPWQPEPEPAPWDGFLKAIGVDFGWDPRPPAIPGDVLFSDSSQNPPREAYRSWTLGDGHTHASLNEPRYRHAYVAASGDDRGYQVTLLVEDRSGPSQAPETRTHWVEVTEPIAATITVGGPSSVIAGEHQRFYANVDEHCTPAPNGWSWTLDGGIPAGRRNRDVIRVLWNEPSPRRRLSAANARCESAIERHHDVEVEPRPIDPIPPKCVESPTALCLRQDRFRVEVRWELERPHPVFGSAGDGMQEPVPGDETGYFWYFNEDNVELIVKVLDGREGPRGTGHFWVFYGSLSDVQFTLTVTDTLTGNQWTRTNPGGFDSDADVLALPGE